MTNQLNKGQQDALKDIEEFISSDRKYHVLTGGPGTGKTFLISSILQQTGMLKNFTNIRVCATTNKAVAAIHDAIGNQYSIDISTIHSALNLRMYNDYSTGESKCAPGKGYSIHRNTFFIIDEISMSNKDLEKYIDEATDSSCKILKVGDKFQLPPVKEKESTAFSKGYTTSILTEPVRNNAQPALIVLCEQLRETVNTGVFKPITPVPGVVDIMTTQETKKFIEDNFKEETPHKKVLAYTNKISLGYSNHIRKFRGYLEPYVIGEYVNNNNAIIIDRKTVLPTDSEVRIHEIRASEDHYGYPVLPVTVEYGNNLIDINVFLDPLGKTDLLGKFASDKNWHDYFKIKERYADLRLSASCTTHKSQGSTCDVTVVDREDIAKCTNNNVTARLLYVAASRAKQRVVFKGDLTQRYYNDSSITT